MQQKREKAVEQRDNDMINMFPAPVSRPLDEAVTERLITPKPKWVEPKVPKWVLPAEPPAELAESCERLHADQAKRAEKRANARENMEQAREAEIKEESAKLHNPSHFNEEVFKRLAEDDTERRKGKEEQRSRMKRNAEEEAMKLAALTKATRPRSKDPGRDLYIQGIAKARRHSEKRREKERDENFRLGQASVHKDVVSDGSVYTRLYQGHNEYLAAKDVQSSVPTVPMAKSLARSPGVGVAATRRTPEFAEVTSVDPLEPRPDSAPAFGREAVDQQWDTILQQEGLDS